MSTQDVLDGIGYVAWHGIRVMDERPGSVTVCLPERADLLNYVGTGHAGAIYTLAETAAGVVADSVAQTLDAFILLRGAEVNYTRRAAGELTAKGYIEGTVAEQVAAVFGEEKRADCPVEVDIRDHGNESVFRGIFLYALRLRK